MDMLLKPALPLSVPECYRQTLRGPLGILLEARRAAEEFGRDPTNGSVSFRELQLHGCTANQFRWLLESGYIRLVPNTDQPPAAALTLPDLRNLLLDPAQVALTPSGADLAEWYLCGSGDGPREQPAPATKPKWDAEVRILRLGLVVVKQFRVPADNQELVLGAFEEDGWPPTIDDPIPAQSSCDPKARLHNTIRRLNSHQLHRCLRFKGNGRGDGVSWELLTRD